MTAFLSGQNYFAQNRQNARERVTGDQLESQRRSDERSASEGLKALLLGALLLLGACSFKSSSEGESLEPRVTIDEVEVTDPKLDSDGDRISDKDELSFGTQPFVADIPEVQVRFIQNYGIYFNWAPLNNREALVPHAIETAPRTTNPEFRYRVGEVLLRSLGLQSAARIARFDSHSWGEINREDLSWVSYPEVDAAFTHAQALLARPIFEAGNHIDGITIKLENSFRLKPHARFKEIKNLKLAFRYFDHNKESYELLDEVVVERVLQTGVAERIDVTLKNIPRALVEDNYLKKGEFIISEVVDFEIPDLGVSYQILLKGVRSKTLPVLVSTPLETRLSYVAVPSNGASFQDVLRRLYDSKFTIEENYLKKIEQFESNLPSYSHLEEVRQLDKQGKWFVFSNKLPRHYLEHRFTTQDVLSLSYLTGTELASQAEEKIYAYWDSASGKDDFQVYPLGDLSSNSRIDLQLKANWRWGEKLTKSKEEYHSNGAGCRGNCSTSDIHCFWDVNKFEARSESFKLSKDYSGELEHVFLVINREEYPVPDLVEKKLVNVRWETEALHLSISDVNTLQELSPSVVHKLALKVKTPKGDDFNGIKLVRMSGKQYYYCPTFTIVQASQTGQPISEESERFPEWRSGVNWKEVQLGTRKSYAMPFSLFVSSSIQNFYN